MAAARMTARRTTVFAVASFQCSESNSMSTFRAAAADVIRHELVARIVAAYDAEAARKRER